MALAKGGLTEAETGASSAAREHEAWEPEWLEGRFFATYRCGNCLDPAIVSGTYTLHEDPSPDYTSLTYSELYRVSAIWPAPRLIRVPEDAPEPITSELDRAFKLFWVDRAACANAIRGVVDEFLNHMRIRKTDGSRKQRGRLTLHSRIELYSEKDPHLASALMATKWIGNVGSHSDDIPRETLFDGFDLLEHVLEEAFSLPRTRAARLAQEINRRKGKAKRKRVSGRRRNGSV
jgi:hypothetical protein